MQLQETMNNKLYKIIENDFMDAMCESKATNRSKMDSNCCDIRCVLHHFIERIDSSTRSNQ